jgi:hypothetical protein
MFGAGSPATTNDDQQMLPSIELLPLLPLATFRRKNNSLRHGDFSSRAVPFLHDRT